jgi:hypothetical protein
MLHRKPLSTWPAKLLQVMSAIKMGVETFRAAMLEAHPNQVKRSQNEKGGINPPFLR